MKIIGSLGFLLFIFGCQHSDSTITSFNYPICIDSIDVEPRILSCKATEEILEYNLRYNLLYIGEEKDTIFIDYKLGLSLIMAPPPPPPPLIKHLVNATTLRDTVVDKVREKLLKTRGVYSAYCCYWDEWTENYKHIIGDSANVNIVVDTNHYVLNYNWDFAPNQPFKAYPVIIKNIEKDTLGIATRNYIELVLEGKNKDIWKPLVQPFRHRGCGNGLTYLLLPPNEILVTSIPVYQWEEPMQLRLKLGNNYSTVFNGRTIVQ